MKKSMTQDDLSLAAEAGRLADLVTEVAGTKKAGDLARCIAIVTEEFIKGHKLPNEKPGFPQEDPSKLSMTKKEIADLEKLLDKPGSPSPEVAEAMKRVQQILANLGIKKR